MKIKLMVDNLNNKSIDDIVKVVGFSDTIFPLIPDIIEYYDKEIPLWQMINHYSEDTDLYEGEERQVQVHCIFPEHGSADYHKSATYFPFDRDSGETRESLWCFKCQIRRGAFTTSLHLERNRNEKWSIVDHFKWLEKNGIPFPKNIIGEFDPEKHFTFDEENSQEEKLLKMFKDVDIIKELKGSDIQEWLEASENIVRGKNVKKQD